MRYYAKLAASVLGWLVVLVFGLMLTTVPFMHAMSAALGNVSLVNPVALLVMVGAGSALLWVAMHWPSDVDARPRRSKR